MHFELILSYKNREKTDQVYKRGFAREQLSSVGPTFDVQESVSSVFLHFWPDDFLQEICAQTNLYAQQVMGPAKYADWMEVNVPEFESLFGVFHTHGDYSVNINV